jgi:hypothetical protein
MSEAVRKNLEQLRDQTDADTFAEVIRKGLAVYEFVWNVHQDGSRFVVRDKDGQEREIVLFP